MSLTTGTGLICYFQVSWLRVLYPIPQVLALNNITNSPDPRITAFHTPGSELYTLRIRNTRVNDAGFYECQVAGRGYRTLQRLIYVEVVGEWLLKSFLLASL